MDNNDQVQFNRDLRYKNGMLLLKLRGNGIVLSPNLYASLMTNYLPTVLLIHGGPLVQIRKFSRPGG